MDSSEPYSTWIWAKPKEIIYENEVKQIIWSLISEEEMVSEPEPETICIPVQRLGSDVLLNDTNNFDRMFRKQKLLLKELASQITIIETPPRENICEKPFYIFLRSTEGVIYCEIETQQDGRKIWVPVNKNSRNLMAFTKMIGLTYLPGAVNVPVSRVGTTVRPQDKEDFEVVLSAFDEITKQVMVERQAKKEELQRERDELFRRQQQQRQKNDKSHKWFQSPTSAPDSSNYQSDEIWRDNNSFQAKLKRLYRSVKGTT